LSLVSDIPETSFNFFPRVDYHVLSLVSDLPETSYNYFPRVDYLQS